MNVLMISPSFPSEMPHFAKGLAAVGARVIGLGEHPTSMMPPDLRRALADYIQVSAMFDEERTVGEVVEAAKRIRIDQIECLWEPGMLLAARLREALGLPGMTVEHTLLFRDKERMKQALDDAGLRVPRHRKAATPDEMREAAEAVGYPLIVKPIAGAGSADTHRVDDAEELERVIGQVQHVAEVSVEEFIEGEEFTFDTICHSGEIAYYNMSWYRPRPLIARTLEWTSPQTLALRDLDEPDLAAGKKLGRDVIKALDFQAGFTHMEWFRTPSGEAVFGEIGCRPPGARSVDLMNYACDLDTFVGWAEAVVHGRFSQVVERRYNSSIIFKRAKGEGRIRAIHGLERLIARYRPHVLCVDLLPVGAHRRNWKQTLMSDGHIILRHPDLQATMEMSDRFGTDLEMLAE